MNSNKYDIKGLKIEMKDRSGKIDKTIIFEKGLEVIMTTETIMSIDIVTTDPVRIFTPPPPAEIAISHATLVNIRMLGMFRHDEAIKGREGEKEKISL